MADPLQVSYNLEAGCALTQYLHPGNEHGWVFEYRYIREEPEGFRKVAVLCEWSCRMGYTNGVLNPGLTVAMHIILPSRLGQKYAYGMDISPGAKTYLEFEYELQPEGHFLLMTVQKGCRPKVKLDRGLGLMQPVDFPFPIPDRIARPKFPDGRVYGDYEVPFLFRDEDDDAVDEVRLATFPPSLKRGKVR